MQRKGTGEEENSILEVLSGVRERKFGAEGTTNPGEMGAELGT